MGKFGVGKPQKSRRHKKILQYEELPEGSRLKSRKREDQKINSRPTSLEQEMPSRVKNIKQFQEQWKELKGVKKRHRKKKDVLNKALGAHRLANQKGMSRPLKPVPQFKQRNRESQQSFMRRVERESQDVIHQSRLEDEYNVDFDNKEDGKTVVEKKPASEKKKNYHQKKEDLKKEKKLTKKQNSINDFDMLRDDVRFGEVVHQPPTITAAPRKSSAVDNRPGKKSLLLKQIIRDNASMTGQSKVKNRELGQTVKRKHLSMAQQVKMDAERDRVVNLYRDMKAKKMKVLDY